MGEWSRPGADTDKLYMSLGGGDMIEVGHPAPAAPAEDPRQAGLIIIINYNNNNINNNNKVSLSSIWALWRLVAASLLMIS